MNTNRLSTATGKAAGVDLDKGVQHDGGRWQERRQGLMHLRDKAEQRRRRCHASTPESSAPVCTLVGAPDRLCSSR